MEVVLQVAALCLVAALSHALLRREAPEMGLALLLGAAVLALTLLLAPAREIVALTVDLTEKTGLQREVFAPLLKAAAVALTVHFGGAVCRDAGASALAVVLESAGAFCALMVMLPLLRAVLETLEGWI